MEKNMKKIPRSASNDYSASMVNTRRQFIENETGTSLPHLSHFSLPPESVAGNIENFTGVAQVPIGFAGPMLVNGEAAQGEFYVPMATTEGTLVASYSRGMRLTREAGGIKTTVIDDAMQRAPIFVFDDARREMRHDIIAFTFDACGCGNHIFDWRAFYVSDVDACACRQKRAKVFYFFRRARHHFDGVALQKRFYFCAIA